MRSAFILGVLLYILTLGLSFPFVAGMAYLWIDIVKPQNLAYSFVNSLPLSRIAAVVVLASYAINANKKSFRLTPVMCLVACLALWVTITTYLANPMLNSWAKWDWAFKGLIFTIIIPLIFRTRVEIEALLLTIIFSIATTTFSAVIKTALGGGGYGVLAVLGNGDSGLSETSTLAAVSIMLIPLLHYVYRNTVIFPDSRIFKSIIWIIGICSVLTVVGTSARTGLIAAAFLLLCYALRSKRKIVFVLILAMALSVGMTLDLKDTHWGQRMSTINTYEKDSSASGRLAVWKWTLGFVAENPLGGGFDAYRLDNIASVDNEGNAEYYPPGRFQGKAFHSIYFEVLGEHGFIGFGLYYSIMFLTLWRLGRIRKFCQTRPDLQWLSDFAMHVREAQGVLLIGGLFIGIAFQPVMFYLVAITISLSGFMLESNVKKNTAVRFPLNNATAS
jgi:putative inorganic carbon (HCO3(-)) transporter